MRKDGSEPTRSGSPAQRAPVGCVVAASIVQRILGEFQGHPRVPDANVRVRSAPRLCKPAKRFPGWAMLLQLLQTTLLAGSMGPQIGDEPAQRIEVPDAFSSTASVSLLLDGEPHRLRLRRGGVRAPAFKLLVDRGMGPQEEAAPASGVYRGDVEGFPNSRVIARFGPTGMHAGGVLVPGVARLDITPGRTPDTAKVALAPPLAATASGEALDLELAQIAYDTDYDYFQKLGSVENVVADIEWITAQLSETFEEQVGIGYLISAIVVRAHPNDPYDSPQIHGILSQFDEVWSTTLADVPRSVAHLFFDQEVTPGNALSLCWNESVCTESGYGVIRTMHPSLTTDIARVQTSGFHLGIAFGAPVCVFDPPCGMMCANCLEPSLELSDTEIAAILETKASVDCLIEPIVPVVTDLGCGLNPPGSLSLTAGEPVLGDTVTFALDNPLGTQPGGSLSALMLSFSADPNYPCGTPIPGWGMSGAGANGELLTGLPGLEPLLVGEAWAPGVPAEVQLGIPDSLVLAGLTLFAQGALWDPMAAFGVEVGLTDGLELTVGHPVY